jgi:DNA-directed RNA polymerase specialized sigma24 family protein
MSISDNPETLLAQKAARGNQEAFATFFQQHFQAVYNYAPALSSDPAEADDFTKDAFIRAHRSLPQFGPPRLSRLPEVKCI